MWAFKPEGHPLHLPAIRNVSIWTWRKSFHPSTFQPSYTGCEYSNPKGIPFTSQPYGIWVFKPERHPLHLPAIWNVSIQTRRASLSPPSHMEYEYSNLRGIPFTSSYMECEFSNPKEIPPPLHFPAELYRMRVFKPEGHPLHLPAIWNMSIQTWGASPSPPAIWNVSIQTRRKSLHPSTSQPNYTGCEHSNPKGIPFTFQLYGMWVFKPEGLPLHLQLYVMWVFKLQGNPSTSQPSYTGCEYSNPKSIPFTSQPYRIWVFKPEGHPLHLQLHGMWVFKPEGNPSTPPLPSRAIQDASIQTRRASPSPSSNMECEYSNPKGFPFTSSYTECEYSNSKEIPLLPSRAIQDVSIQTQRASPSPPSHMEYEYSNPKGIRFTSSYMECEYSNPKEIPPPLHFPAELYRMWVFKPEGHPLHLPSIWNISIQTLRASPSPPAIWNVSIQTRRKSLHFPAELYGMWVFKPEGHPLHCPAIRDASI